MARQQGCFASAGDPGKDLVVPDLKSVPGPCERRNIGDGRYEGSPTWGKPQRPIR